MSTDAERQQAWRYRGACLDAPNPDAFLTGRPSGSARALAVRYCAGCPVRQQCEAHAVATRSQGIWGGWWFPTPTRGYGDAAVDLLGQARR